MSGKDFDPNAPGHGDGVFGLPFTREQSRYVILPVPFEATTSYRRGTRNGPAAVLRESRQVDLTDRVLGPVWKQGIFWDVEGLPIPSPNVRDPAVVNPASERMNALVQEWTARALAEGKVAVIVGGEHSVSFGAIAAYAEKFPGLGILHVDAHADLRRAYEGYRWSHASIMNNVLEELPGVARLVQVGIRDVCDEELQLIEGSGGRVRTFFDADIAERLAGGQPWKEILAEIIAALPRDVYVSFDVDGLDPSLCPDTGTPVPGGLTWREAVQLLLALARSDRRIVGFDVTEVAPAPGGRDGDWNANVGARLLYQLIGATGLPETPSPSR